MDYLRGAFTAPWIVGIARGMAEAAALAALYVIVDFIAGGGLPDQFAFAGPIALLAVRPIEGLLDQIDANKQRARDLAYFDDDTIDGDEDEPSI